MAVKLDEQSHKAEEAEVSNCVSNLIQAFSNGFNVFKRLRERRRKKKARKENQAAEAVTSDELQLSKSLRRGPQELAENYDAFYSQTGQRFAKGDGKHALRDIRSRCHGADHCCSNRTCISCRDSHQAKYRPGSHHRKLPEP
jgi:hypothetical protein